MTIFSVTFIFCRLLRNSSVRKLNTWFPINARQSMWIASKVTLLSQARTRARARFNLTQIHQIMLATETKGGPKDKQTWLVQVLNTISYLGLKPHLIATVFPFFLQFVPSRGKSLVDRVVKEQVCSIPTGDIYIKMCSFMLVSFVFDFDLLIPVHKKVHSCKTRLIKTENKIDGVRQKPICFVFFPGHK